MKQRERKGDVTSNKIKIVKLFVRDIKLKTEA
jgi:hypothetical protein